MKTRGIGKLFNGMKISTKIILSNIFFLIPMGIMLFISLAGINYDIRFSSLELYGNEYQQPLESLLQYIHDHQRYYSDKNNQNDLADIEKKIDSAFNKLETVQDERGEDLQFTQEGLRIRNREHLFPSLIRARWNDVKHSGDKSEYSSLIKDIREMITHSGDTSNLILDPDLDSYYLMDLSLLVLPQTQDRLGEILLYGYDLLSRMEKEGRGELSPEEKLKFYVYANMLEESDYSRIAGSTKTAVNEDQNFYGIYPLMQSTIPASFESYAKPNLEFIEMLYDLGTSETIDFSADQFKTLGEEARNESFTYWYDVVRILDDLLGIRINNYRQLFIKYLIAAIITTICAFLIFLAIRKNILSSINKLQAGFQQASERDLTTSIEVDAKDEIARCSNDFNDLMINFSDLMRKLQDMTAVLTESVQNLNVTSQEVFATSNEQAAAVKEIVTTMEDSDSLTKSVATRISEISVLASETTEAVRNGFGLITTIIEKMTEIQASNSETIKGVKFLSEKIENIWEIVNLINGIADQTKIIAFNAELEASSAGEAGKSFQLVATEIRRLADSTVSSTSEIKNKINEIQRSSDALIVSSEDGTRKISEGSELTGRMNSVFEGILNSTERTSTSTDSISGSINQQVSSFEQILLTLKQISEGIDNFVVATKASATSAETLKGMAEELDGRIEMYNVS